MSKFFINRPIFATVLAILMVLAGLITVKSLPVAQFPEITPPTVMVSASYPGADAATVAQAVGIPIEQQVNGVENMLYMSSSSGSDGSYSLTITFEQGTDIDQAAVKVQNRVSLAQPQLPQAVTRTGVNVQTRSSDILMFIALTGDADNEDALYLANYANIHLSDELARVEGVGNVGVFGGGDYSMRVWLDPDKMRIRGVTPAEVTAAIRQQNIQVSAGSVGTAPAPAAVAFDYTLSANGRLTTPRQFGDIIIRSDKDGFLRLGDIARVERGSSSYANITRVNGRSSAAIAISQLPGANAVDVSKNVRRKLEELKQYMPQGVNAEVLMDSTQFVDASINDVVVTFVETTLIVMLVIMFFLQNARAVIIPMLTIPVSLIATFAVMKLLGFSLNTLTLFGLVLAIAIVVDDAIVVVEDCQRIIDEGKMNPKQAAIQAMKELTGPVVGEVLVLMSVFIPTAFISGTTGQLYKQFALTIAVSTAFSGFNALTFTPAMCSLFLRKRNPGSFASRFKPFVWFNRGYDKILAAYNRGVGRLLKRPLPAIAFYGVLCVCAFWLYGSRPTSYIPEEDLGYFITSIELPTEASLSRTDSIVTQVAARIKKLPEVKDVLAFSGASFVGGSGTNFGSLFVMLKPWSQRKGKSESAQAVIDKCDEICADIEEAIVFSINPPAIPGLGTTSGLEMELLDINDRGPQALAEAIDQISAQAMKSGKFANVRSMYQGSVPQFSIKVNRDRAEQLGLSLDEVYSTLSAFMGSEYVNDYNQYGRSYQVNISGDAKTRATVQGLRSLSAGNDRGEMVPFPAFCSIERSMGQPNVSRYNMYTAASLTATTAKGTSMSEGIKALEEAVNKSLGSNYTYAWTGEAYQQTQSGATITSALLFAVIITLLVLAAQYESWTSSVSVIIAMPTALLGAVLGVILMSQNINIYTQIGIILLLGMAAKNAILIVEYAMDFRKQGVPLAKAAAEAGNIRFRPIMMTACAFVFGVMPMLFASGAGAQSRISLASAVVFGMAMNALVGTLFVPNFWLIMTRLHERFSAPKPRN